MSEPLEDVQRRFGVRNLREVAAVELPELQSNLGELAIQSKEALDALAAVNDPAFLFRYAGVSVRIEYDEDDGSPVVAVLDTRKLRYHLARAARYYALRKDGTRIPAHPPSIVVEDILAAPDCPWPPLRRIVEVPVFTRNGAIATGEGYDPATKLYLRSKAGLRKLVVPDAPNADDIRRARSLLVDELLADFPFSSSTPEAELAHAVALILLPFARDLIDGPTPLHLLEAPTPGTGKSLLAGIALYVGTGREVAGMSPSGNDEEMRKRLTSQFMRGSPVILFDNVRGRVEYASLAAALTLPVWEDRVLGRNETVTIPIRSMWVMTGNNPDLSDEIARRTARSRLDAGAESPHLRTNFRHADLRAWVRANHRELVEACLTLVRAWIVRGSPPWDGKALGSFESWCAVIGGILEVAGVEGFMANAEEVYAEADRDGQAFRRFVGDWWSTHGEQEVSAGELVAIAAEHLDLAASSESAQSKRLGKLLAKYRDRVFSVSDDQPGVQYRVTWRRSSRKPWRLVLSLTDVMRV